MKSFPICWNKTLAQLGFRRKVHKTKAKGHYGRRPLFESLESRQMLAAHTVTTLADVIDANDGFTSLREAINLAALAAGNDTITFAPDLGNVLELQSALLLGSSSQPIQGNITIEGPGADMLALDANGASRVIDFASNSNYYSLTLRSLGFTGASGNALHRDGGDNVDVILDEVKVFGNGAGLSFAYGGNLTITNSEIADNAGTGVSFAYASSLTMTGSTVARNAGVGVTVGYASASIKNSTISCNETAGPVAGLSISVGNYSLINVTIADNRADANNSSGNSTAMGGVSVGYSGTLTMHNTIVARNWAGADNGSAVPADIKRASGGTIAAASSYNLIAFDPDLANGLNADPTVKHNIVGGENGAPAIDPKISPLGTYGGPTKTHVPLEGSLAINAGSNTKAAEHGIHLDQRGFERLPIVSLEEQEIIDIGAVEASDSLFLVDTETDEIDGDYSPGDRSLREALALANTIAGVQQITFSPSLPSTLTLSQGEVILASNVEIVGRGYDKFTIDANEQSRVFKVLAGAEATIRDLAITGGRVTAASSGGNAGGGIFNTGDLTLDTVVVSNNATDYADNGSLNFGGGIYSVDGTLRVIDTTVDGNRARDGGGIAADFNGGTLEIIRSTISNNIALNSGNYGGGGGLFLSGTATSALAITNSTFSGNESGEGGGIRVEGADTEVTIINATITDNHADVSGGVAGGILNAYEATITMHNTILAANTSADAMSVDVWGNVGGTTGTPSSHNILGVQHSAILPGYTEHSGLANGTYGNQVGSETIPRNSLLAPLNKYDGPTKTHALLIGSPAVDRGNDSLAVDALGTPLIVDQRGHHRPIDDPSVSNVGGNTVDIGAFEAGNPTPFEVNVLDDEVDGIFPQHFELSSLSLREALAMARHFAGTDTIKFADKLFENGPVTITIDYDGQLNGIPDPLLINSNVIIDGPGADLLTVSGDNRTRVFEVESGKTATIQELRITGGSHGEGAGILSSGILTVDSVEIDGNRAQFNGAGIRASAGSLTVKNSTISNNTLVWYGAGITIASGAVATIINSTVSANKADYSTGGIYDESTVGSQIINSTVTANSSTYGAGGGVRGNAATKLHNSIVAGNFAGTSTPKDLEGTFHASSSYNLIGFDSSLTNNINNGEDNNQVGEAGTGIDAGLRALGHYGGPVRTHSLLPHSRAIDAGVNSIATVAGLSADQRGFTRIVDFNRNNSVNNVDIGAYEYGIRVTTLTDEDGSEPNNASQTSLREALQIAGDAPTPDQIVFDAGLPRGTIELSYGLSIGSSVDIIGPGSDQLAIDAMDSDRVFRIADEGAAGGAQISASIKGVTIRGGNSNSGAGIWNSGQDLTLIDVNISNNRALGIGGGISSNGGSLTLIATTVANNTATNVGGGVYINASHLKIINSDIVENISSSGGGGIYIESANSSEIVASKVRDNRASQGGGGILHSGGGQLTLDGSSIVGNRTIAQNTNGGGISSIHGHLRITNSEIKENSATRNGGGIYRTGSMEIVGSKIFDNQALIGGAISHITTASSVLDITGSEIQNNRATAISGGIHVDRSPSNSGLIGSVEILGSTISHNVTNKFGSQNLASGISLLHVSDASIHNSTISHNKNDDQTGGLYIAESGSVQLTNVTIAFNESAVSTYAGLRATNNASVSVRNSIIAGNKGMGPESDISGTFNQANSSHNLIGTGSAPIGTNNVHLLGADPKLTPLGYHGGKLPTIGLMPGSGAIDRGSSVYSGNLDQRGFPRPVDGDGNSSSIPDIGVFELEKQIIKIADFNGDGRNDQAFFDDASGNINVLLDLGDRFELASWGKIAPTSSGANWTVFKAGDFNGDGRDDIAAYDWSTHLWSIAVSDSTQFNISGTDIFTVWSALYVGDFDGDGSDELLGWNSVDLWWEVVKFSEDFGPSLDTSWGSAIYGIENLTSLQVADANRDGRDDVIGYDGTDWHVGLSQLLTSGINAFVYDDPNANTTGWGTWFNGYVNGDGTVRADERIQKIIDEFSWVYNNVELELYRGFMKGIEATAQTKGGNPWDQAALLVDRLDKLGLDAKIAIGKIEVPLEIVRDWIGAPPEMLDDLYATGDGPSVGLLRVIQQAFDQNATYSSSTGKFTFNHAWVRVTVPTASGLVEVELEPSWKFKDHQPGIYLTRGAVFGTKTAAGSFDVYPGDSLAQLEYVPALNNLPFFTNYGIFPVNYIANGLTREAPLELLQTQVETRLPGFTAAFEQPVSGSITNVPYDGPIIPRHFSTIPHGLPGSSSSVITYADLDAIVSNTTAKNLWTHRVEIEVSGTSGTSILIDHEIATASHALQQASITMSGQRPDLNLFYLGNEIGSTLVEGSGSLQSGEQFRLTIKTFVPGINSGTNPGTDATEVLEFGQNSAIAIGINASQFSSQRIGDIQNDLLDKVSTVDATDIDNLLSYTISKYWHDLNRSQSEINALAQTATIVSHVGIGVVSASSAFDIETNISEFAPYALVPDELAIDIRTIGAFDYRWNTGLRTVQTPWAVRLQANSLEHTVIEEVTSEQAVSAVKGLQQAFLRVLGIDENGNAPIAQDDEVLVFNVVGTNIVHVDKLYLSASGPRLERFSHNGLPFDYPKSNILPTLKVYLDHHDVDPNDAGANPIAEEIAAIISSPNTKVGTAVFVPRYRTKVSDWTGSVFAANVVTESTAQGSSSFDFVIIPDGDAPLGGGMSVGQPLNSGVSPSFGNDAFHTLAGNSVDVANGNVYHQATDIVYPNLGNDLSFDRRYNSQNIFELNTDTTAVEKRIDLGLGVGWTHSFSDRLLVDHHGEGGTTHPDLAWLTSMGGIYRFVYDADMSEYIVPPQLFGELADDIQGYKYLDRDGTEIYFTTANHGQTGIGNTHAVLSKKLDLNGDGYQVTYDAVHSDNIIRVEDIHNSNRKLVFQYDPGNKHIISVTRHFPYAQGSSIDGTWTYAYEDINHGGSDVRSYLVAVSSPTNSHASYVSNMATTVRYDYYGQGPSSTDPSSLWGFLMQISDPNEVASAGNGSFEHFEYYLNGRAFRVTDADQNNRTFTYNLARNETQLVDKLGEIEKYLYQANGLLRRHILQDGSRTEMFWGVRNGDYDEVNATTPIIEGTDYLLQFWTTPNGAVGRNEYYTDENEFRFRQIKRATTPQFRNDDIGYRGSPFFVPEIIQKGIVTEYDYIRPELSPGTVNPAKNHVVQIKSTIVDPSTVVPGGKNITTTYKYDQIGRLVKTIDPLGNVRAREYILDVPTTSHLYGLPKSEIAPNGFEVPHAGQTDKHQVLFKTLGEVDITASSLRVELARLAATSGRLFADAVRIDRIGDAGTSNASSVLTGTIDDELSGFMVTQGTGTADTSVITAIGARVTLLDDVNDKGVWTFLNLIPGRYRISISLDADAANTADAAYKVFDGAAVTEKASFSISQSSQPTFKSHEVLFGYDAAGNIAETYSEGIRLGTSTYDSSGNLRSSTDSTGLTKSYGYDVLGRQRFSVLADPDGASGPLKELRTTFTYDASGQLLSSEDPLGRATTYEYDRRGNVEKVIYADGSLVTMEFDAVGNQVARIDELGRTTRFVYDGRNRPIQTVHSDGAIERVRYDSAGNLLAKVDAILPSTVALGIPADLTGHTTTFSYDGSGRLLTTTNASGITATNTYDSLGRLEQVKDYNGNLTRYKYDLLGRVIETRNYGTTTTVNPITLATTSYDQNGNIEKVVSYDMSSVSVSVLVTDNPETKITSETLKHRTQYVYDGLNRAVQTIYIGAGTSNANVSTGTVYDGAGRIRFQYDEMARPTEFRYDKYGRIQESRLAAPSVTEASPVTKFTYDAAGNIIAIEDANGNTAETILDARNRVIAATDAKGETTRTFFDAAGQLIVTVDALGRASYVQYDSRGRVRRTRLADPDGNGTETAPETLFEYDARGNVKRTIDALGYVTEYEYDALNRKENETFYLDRVADNTSSVIDKEYKILQGTPTNVVDSEGFGGDAVNIIRTDGDQKAVVQWTFGNVSKGNYRISLTWEADSSLDSSAKSDIVVGTTPVASNIPVDQKKQPADFAINYEGRWIKWEELASGISVTSDNTTVTVTLTSNVGGKIQADAVRLERVSARQFGYDANGNIASTTDTRDNITEYKYDALNRLTRVTSPDPDGPTQPDGSGSNQRSVKTYEYDGYGNVKKEQDAYATTHAANPTYFRDTIRQFDKRNRLILEILDNTGNAKVTTKFEYDNVGNVVRVFDAFDTSDEVITKYTYDNLNRQTEQIVDTGREVADPANPQPNTRSNVKQKTAFAYDPLGNLVLTTEYATSAGNSPSVQARNVYDAVNRLIQVDEDFENPLRTTTRYAYDAVGNLISETDPRGRTTVTHYDRLNQVIESELPDPDGAGPLTPPLTTFQYDPAGNLISETNGEGETTRFVHDALGQQTRSTDALGSETRSNYDSEGNLISITDPGQSTTVYAYDAANRLTKDTNQLGYSRSYTYDDKNQLRTVVDRNERIRDFTYDGLGRLTREEWRNEIEPDGNDPADSIVHFLSWQYDRLGRVLKANDVPIDGTTTSFNTYSFIESTGAHRETFTYDNLGRVLEERNYDPTITTTNNPLSRQQFVYDILNLSDPKTFVQSTTTQYLAKGFQTTEASVGATTSTFDRLGQLTNLAEDADATTGVTKKELAFKYSSAGDLVGISRKGNHIGSAYLFQVDATYTYDRSGRLSQLLHAVGQGAVVQYSYGYDAASRITDLATVNGLANVMQGRAHEIEYDPTGQLTGYSTTQGNGSDNSYEYDVAGNRTTGSDGGYSTDPSLAGYQPNNNQIVADDTYDYFYDREGNLSLRINKTTGATTEYLWDHRNRLYEKREFNSPPVNFNNVTLVNYAPHSSGTSEIRDYGYTLRLDNWGGKAIDFGTGGYTITPNTIIEFDFRGLEQSEIATIFFTNETSPFDDGDRAFFLYGSNGSGAYIDSVNGLEEYVRSDGTKHYRIRIGSYYSQPSHSPGYNAYRFLAFHHFASNTHDGTSEFSNVRIYEELNAEQGMQSRITYRYNANDLVVRKEADSTPYRGFEVNFNGLSLSDYDASATPGYSTGSYSMTSDGSSITLTGSTEIAIDLNQLNGGTPYEFNADTVIEFDFSSTDQSQVNGFILDNQLVAWPWQTDGRQFDLYGHQQVSQFVQVNNDQGVRYNGGGTAQHFTIRLGDYPRFSGLNQEIRPYRYLVLTNRNHLSDGVNNTGNSTFSNIRIYQEDVLASPGVPILKTDTSIEHYVYSGDQLAMVLDNAGRINRRYTYGPGTDNLVVEEVFDDTSSHGQLLRTQWPLTDHMGSVRDIIEDDYDSRQHIEYDSFGNVTEILDQSGIPVEVGGEPNLDALDSAFGFAGRTWDNDVDLYYNRARWYDPAKGRFISQDPSGFGGGDTNLYRYAANSPANFRDPSGRFFDYFDLGLSDFGFDYGNSDFDYFDYGAYDYGNDITFGAFDSFGTEYFSNDYYGIGRDGFSFGGGSSQFDFSFNSQLTEGFLPFGFGSDNFYALENNLYTGLGNVYSLAQSALPGAFDGRRLDFGTFEFNTAGDLQFNTDAFSNSLRGLAKGFGQSFLDVVDPQLELAAPDEFLFGAKPFFSNLADDVSQKYSQLPTGVQAGLLASASIGGIAAARELARAGGLQGIAGVDDYLDVSNLTDVDFTLFNRQSSANLLGTPTNFQYSVGGQINPLSGSSQLGLNVQTRSPIDSFGSAYSFRTDSDLSLSFAYNDIFGTASSRAYVSGSYDAGINSRFSTYEVQIGVQAGAKYSSRSDVSASGGAFGIIRGDLRNPVQLGSLTPVKSIELRADVNTRGNVSIRPSAGFRF